MLQALLYGKLSRDIEGMEDVLTSSVFGILKEIPFKEGVLPLLKTARSIGDIQNPFLALTDASMEMQFWPWIKKADYYGCEPDVLIRINAEGLSAIVLIEAKYKSGKSSQENSEDFRPTDQLSREWVNLAEIAREEGRLPLLLYLTADIAIPRRDISDSIAELRKKSGELLEQYPPRFLWISWRHLKSLYENSNNPFLQSIVLLLKRLNLNFYEGLGVIDNYDIKFWNFSRPEIHFDWNCVSYQTFEWRYAI